MLLLMSCSCFCCFLPASSAHARASSNCGLFGKDCKLDELCCFVGMRLVCEASGWVPVWRQQLTSLCKSQQASSSSATVGALTALERAPHRARAAARHSELSASATSAVSFTPRRREQAPGVTRP